MIRTALLLACLPQPQGHASLDGVSVLESRDLAAQFRDVDRFLAEGNTLAAAAALQQILEAGHDLLVRPGIELRFEGAVYKARMLMKEVSPEVLAAREELVGEKAAAFLREAMEPPDPVALRRVANLYAGTTAAARAEVALREVLFDQGYAERAAAGRTYEELLPPKWIDALPAPQVAAPLLVPFVDSWDDPELPLVRSSGAHLRWTYRFKDSPTPQGYANHRMALAGGRGYLTNAREVVALDLGTGEVIWRYTGPPHWHDLSSKDFNKLIQGFSPETILAPVVAEGVVLAPIHEPRELGRSQDFSRIAVRRFLPGRRLYAFDAETGKILWKQDVEWLHGNQREPRGLVAAPPAVAAGRVFVPIYDAVGTLDLRMVALDLHTGEQLWSTFLVSGQRETNLFGNVLTELACSPPAADSERVILCTNLGAICALDAATGAVIWTRLYERTSVHTYQTGDIGKREVTFANGPPAYDGRRFVCAPTDSAYATALDAETGAIYANWKAGGPRSDYGEMRWLVGATPDGALFNGRKLAFLNFRGRGGRFWKTGSLTRLFMPNSMRSAVLARQEILVPTADGVIRFDPATGNRLGLAFAWGKVRQGALQAAPGLLLVMSRNGVSALASPDALLETLLEIGAEPERIGRTLPFLEGLKIDRDPDKALLVARAAWKLAERTSNREYTERLRLVAGRAFLDARKSEQAGEVVGPVLASTNRLRKVGAALVVLDALERVNPNSSLMRKSLSVLERYASSEVKRHLEGRQPIRFALARARYFAARAAGDLDAQRETLLELVRLPMDERVLEEGEPLPVWAGQKLRKLLEDFPGQAAVMEREAARAFSKGPVTASLVRAFAGTRTSNRWLSEQLQRTDLDRGERITISAWLRDFLAPDRLRESLSADEIYGRPQLPALPSSLVQQARFSLERMRLLGVGAAPEGAYLLLERRGEISLVHIGSDERQREICKVLPDSSWSRRYLRGGFYFSDAGATVVTREFWVRLGINGRVEVIRLPGSAVLQYRIGRMAAVLLESATPFGTGNRTWRLQIRDLDTGALFFDARLGPAGLGVPGLIGDGTTLALLVSGNREGRLFRPLESNQPQTFELPWIPTSREVEASVPWGSGILVPNFHAGERALFLVRPEETLILPQPPDALIRPFSAPGGAGWFLEPTGNIGSGPFPWPVVAWLPTGSDRPLKTEFTDFFRTQAPQIRRPGSTRLPDRSLLLTSRGSAERTRFQVVDFDPAGGGPYTAWTTEVEVPYRKVSARLQPTPVRGSNGWFVVLRLNRTSGEDARLYSLLFSDTGEILGRFPCPPPDNQNDAEAFAAGHSVVIRSGTKLYLLGD